MESRNYSTSQNRGRLAYFSPWNFGLAGTGACLHRARRPGQTMYAYVGCYTSAKRYARGEGIAVFQVDGQTSTWRHVQTLGGLANPSFLILRKDQRYLYAAHGDEAHASAFSIDPATGRLTLLNQVETGGMNGVHLALDSSWRFLVIANYTSGGVSVLRVNEDGRLADLLQVVQLPGSPGPHRVEQSSAHPHQILFEPGGRFVVVPDKGLDRVFVFGFDQKTGQLTPTADTIRTPSPVSITFRR